MIKIKMVKPMFNTLVTTMDVYENDAMTAGGLIDVTKQQGTLKEYQKVVAVGSFIRDIQVGDIVCVNPTRFGKKKHQEGSLKDGIISDNPVVTYNFDTIILDGVPHLILQDRDIDFVVVDYEEVPDEPVVTPKKADNNIIIPHTSIIC